MTSFVYINSDTENFKELTEEQKYNALMWDENELDDDEDDYDEDDNEDITQYAFNLQPFPSIDTRYPLFLLTGFTPMILFKKQDTLYYLCRHINQDFDTLKQQGIPFYPPCRQESIFKYLNHNGVVVSYYEFNEITGGDYHMIK